MKYTSNHGIHKSYRSDWRNHILRITTQEAHSKLPADVSDDLANAGIRPLHIPNFLQTFRMTLQTLESDRYTPLVLPCGRLMTKNVFNCVDYICPSSLLSDLNILVIRWPDNGKHNCSVILVWILGKRCERDVDGCSSGSWSIQGQVVFVLEILRYHSVVSQQVSQYFNLKKSPLLYSYTFMTVYNFGS
jgi:hypothetical protein